MKTSTKKNPKKQSKRRARKINKIPINIYYCLSEIRFFKVQWGFIKL